ncbi:MAG: lysophospholipid acyltransferase family protein [Pyrinomonadaceae bacterium]
MTATIKRLGLGDLLFRRKGSIAFRVSLGIFDVALKLFFRRIETVNADTVPRSGGVIFALNHPNGLIDPALVFVALPRKISFLAKSTLFQTPVISYLLRTVEALPLYRRIDPGEDTSKNLATFKACRGRLKRGGSIALFPEGVSHNSPKLLPLKTGAARIALGAASVHRDEGEVVVGIVPVGLYYSSKTTFRSEAMIYFGPSFPVEPVTLDDDGQPPRDAVRELTGRIETALREVTLNAETESDLARAHQAERIFAAGKWNDDLSDRFRFIKEYIDERRLTGTNGKDHDRLQALIHEYDRKLIDRGIAAEHLSLAELPRGFVVRQAILRSWTLLLTLPFAIAGIIVHFPAYQLCKLFSYVYTHHGADDVVSTVKVLAAMVFMPITWLVIALVLYFYVGWWEAIVSIPIAVICGYAALHTLENIQELRGWGKAIWLFFTNRDMFLRLFVERQNLHEQLMKIN